MDLRLDESDQLLADQARALLAAEATPGRLAGWEASDDGFPAEVWARLVRLGWPGLAFPETVGGGGGTMVSLGVVAAAVGAAALPGPFLPTVCAGLVAQRLGTTKRASALLEEVCRDGAPASLLWPAVAPGVVARRVDRAIVLTGQAVVEWAQRAQTIVCMTPLAGEPERVALVAVDPHAPGVTVAPRAGFDNERVAWVSFDAVSVAPADHLVGDGVCPAADAAAALGAVRLVRAAEMVGGAARILELTTGYVTDRVQFGVPLGTFQAVQHACADVAIAVEGARLATWEGLSGAGGGKPSEPGPTLRRRGALAAWLAGRAYVAAAVTGAQLHGGVGMIRDYPLHFYYRRAKAMQLRLGSAATQLEELAAVVVDPLVSSSPPPG